ncbi:MAG: hypothetical protein QXQ70_04930 [Candidatus Caldarchaeum sp.]
MNLRGVLLVFLTVSIILRGLILAFDGLLWYDNPVNGHGYALAVFTVVDVVLLSLLVLGRAVRAVMVWAIFQTLAMALNPFTAFTINISPEEFALYLFGVTPIGSTSSFSCPFLCPPFRYSYTALLIVQMVMAAAAYRLRKV